MAARKSRSLYSTKNIITGIGGQIINIVLGFVARTFFINAWTEYLGVSSLFTTILTMLNISELIFPLPLFSVCTNHCRKGL